MSDRYNRSSGWFRRCGRSGLQFPAISLGFWQNFGGPGTASHGVIDPLAFHETARQLVHTAFDTGITHFDFANNYGPPPGAAEERCGRILRDLPRGEILVSSKAGYRMWPGPYGDGGSRKYLVQSCDDSLRRLQLDHLDIFYHHRPDPNTPLEESLAALDFIVRSGRALYAGISSYPATLTADALAMCQEHQWTRPVIHQPKYNLLERGIELELIPLAEQERLGLIVFSPLAQGLLTDKYLDGIPGDSRAANAASVSLQADRVDAAMVARLRKLSAIASERGQSLAQMAITWILRQPMVCSALMGASRPEQITDAVRALDAAPLSPEELQKIDEALAYDSP